MSLSPRSTEALNLAAIVKATVASAESTWKAFLGLPALEKGVIGVLLACGGYMVRNIAQSLGSRRNYTLEPDRNPPIHYPLDEIAAAGRDDKKVFLALYPFLRNELLRAIEIHHDDIPATAVEWILQMMDYTVPGGKLNRGTTVVSVVRRLQGSDPTSLARAAVLGWAIELLQAFFLIADDCMDDSQTRRGQPCWYKRPEVQLIAVNDSFLLESFVFGVLRRHFGHDVFYTQILELFLDVTQKTEYGQLLDLTSQPQNGTLDLDKFTLQRYKAIVKYKTAYYSFYLPVACGLVLTGYRRTSDYAAARTILLQMGEYFQVQDDYLDCYGDPTVIGKIGTDIQETKCGWLVVQALQRCTPEQRAILQANYGVWDDGKVAKVKALYKEMNLEKVFQIYEEESYKQLRKQIDEVNLPRVVFEILLNKIYKRSK